jgi:hypothetical protein
MRRRERRRKQLPDDIKETRIYWELKEEALACTLWRSRFGYGLVRQPTSFLVTDVFVY